MYTVGSLYAGVGGICLGFEKAGAKLLWANEYDNEACQTYRLNFSHKLYEEDVWKLKPEDVEKVDIITAGFPCQPFSVAGYKKGFKDERGNHFFRIMNFVEIIKPRVIFLENVKNLRNHDNGKTFEIIRKTIKEMGYSFHVAVLNTMEYGNIPQTRERIYMVCFRNGRFGENAYAHNFKFPSNTPLKKTIHDIIDNRNGVEERFYYREDKYMYKDLIKEIRNKNTVYQWRRKYVRENKSNVCPTLTANMGTGGHNVPLILSEYGIRKLTPRECFQFQGFPKNFELPSNVSISHLYKQAGNSVSVPVIERIASNILKTLNNEIIKDNGKYINNEIYMPSLF